MQTGDPPFVKKVSQSPWGQAVFVLLLILGGIGIAHASTEAPLADWTVAAAGMLLFAAGNPILGIFQKRWPRYVLFSFIAFGVTLTLTLFLAQATAGSLLRDLTQFQMFFVAASLFFLLSTGLVGLYRFILRLLQDA